MRILLYGVAVIALAAVALLITKLYPNTSSVSDSVSTRALSTSDQAPVSQGSITATSSRAAYADRSELDLAIGTVAIPLIVDPAGRRTGRPSAANTALQEIPNSAYLEDAIGSQTSHLIQISQPTTGKYSIVLTGVQTGSYELSLRAFSTDGGSEPAVVVGGEMQDGSHTRFLLDFNSAPGARPSLTTLRE